MKDPRSFELQRRIVKRATTLAKLRYGTQELAECSLSGLGGRRVLDADILDGIRKDVLEEFDEQLSLVGDTNALWQKCRNAISNLCKDRRAAIQIKKSSLKLKNIDS